MKYIVYDGTGAILRMGNCPESMMDMQALEGEHVIEGEANDQEHFVDIETGHVKRYPEG